MIAVVIVAAQGIASGLVTVFVNVMGNRDPAFAEQARKLVSEAMTPATFLISAAVSTGAFAGIALFAGLIAPEKMRARLRLGPSGASPLQYLAALVAMLAIGQAMESAVALLGSPSFSLLEVIGNVARNASLPLFAVLLVLGAVGAGFGEELFFRGYIQTRLSRRWGRWPAIVIASACFGAAHGDILHAPLAAVMGLFLGWLAERFGSVRPGIFVHLVNNAISFCLARWLVAEPPKELHGAMLAAGIAVAAGCLWLLRERPGSAPLATTVVG
jgi:membrane protease YdiL (CAAX protease family)